MECLSSMGKVLISISSMVKYAHNPSIEVVEARGSEVQGHPGLWRAFDQLGLTESLTKNKKRKKKNKRTRKAFFIFGSLAMRPMNQLYNQDPEKCGVWERGRNNAMRGSPPGKPDPTTELLVWLLALGTTAEAVWLSGEDQILAPGVWVESLTPITGPRKLPCCSKARCPHLSYKVDKRLSRLLYKRIQCN